MLGFPPHGSRAVDFAAGVDEVEWIEEVTTFVALIAAGIVVLAPRTSALHEAIC